MTEHGSSSRRRSLAPQPQTPADPAASVGGLPRSQTPATETTDGGTLTPALSQREREKTGALSQGERENVATSPANQPPLETQPTVITKSPLAQYPLAGMHPRDMGRLLEGESLGHFDLIEYVGGGGMGAVFRALDTMLNRTVAVKVLSQDQSGDDETLRRFQNEAQSAARLDHENISRVHYVGEDRGWHYIVFEFIEGANVRDLVNESGPLSLADAVSYTLQIADALVHASGREVVHRDIKPSNVLITPDGRAKLVDMGLARLHQVEPDGEDLTASGVTLGTFDYISPEQARDPRSADVRSDIYSLGCTLYFVLTGRPPFPEGTVLQKLLQHQGDEPADPRTFRPDLPEDLLQIMQRMLAKSPGKRYQSPTELVAELAAFAQRHGLPATPTTSVVWVPPEQTPLNFWERHLPWMVPVALLVILVGVLNLFWPHDSGRAAPPPLHMPATEVDQSTAPAAIASEKTPMNDAEKQPAKEPENAAVPAAPATPAPITPTPAAGSPAPESPQSAPAASSTGPSSTAPSINNPASESTEKKAPVKESKETKASDSESTPAKPAGVQGTVSPSP